MSKKPSNEELESRIQALLKRKAELQAKSAPEPVVDTRDADIAAVVDEINALRHAQAHPLPHTADQSVELMAPAKVEQGADADFDKVIVEVPESKGTHLPEQQTVDAVAQRNAQVEAKRADDDGVAEQKKKAEVDVTKDLTPKAKSPKAVKYDADKGAPADPKDEPNPPVNKK